MKSAGHVCRVRSLVVLLHRLLSQCWIAPRQLTQNWFRHVYRELNSRADALAGEARRTKRRNVWSRTLIARPFCIRGHFDGSHGADDSAVGWYVECAWQRCRNDGVSEPLWHEVARAGFCIGTGTVMRAELEACTEVTNAMVSILSRGRVLFHEDGRVVC